MAIDTRNKRSSAIAVGSPWRAALPAPDAAIGQADRQHIAWLYAGILAAGQVSGAGMFCDAATYSVAGARAAHGSMAGARAATSSMAGSRAATGFPS